MNKNELVAMVAGEGGITRSDANKAVDMTLDAISRALRTKSEVRLVGFGTFTVSKRSESEGRNPRTGEVIRIPAAKLPKFRPGKALREAINAA